MEAAKYNVLPLDDRVAERANPDLAGRPQLVGGHRQLFYGGMSLSAHSCVNILNKSHAVTAEVVAPDAGANGVILAVGGRFGGFSLYAHEGRPKYCYNFFGLRHFFVEGDLPIPTGTHQVRMEFAYDGGGLGKGGDVTLYVDGREVGRGRVENSVPFGFSLDEPSDVGRDTASPVSPDYGAQGNAFTGTVNWIEVDVDEAALDEDHILTGEERFRIAMARQ